MAAKQNLPLSRVHMHPYGSFLMCYKRSEWNDARDAITKSSVVLPAYCQRDENGMTPENWASKSQNYAIGERPRSIQLPNGTTLDIKKDELQYHFALNDEIDCYLQYFIKCLKVVKTAGMGDTISATGWIYHTPKLEAPKK